MLTLIAITTCALLSDHDRVTAPTNPIEYLTRESALQDVTVGKFTCRLVWAKDWRFNPEYEFLFVYHESGLEKMVFDIYLKLTKGYVCIKHIERGDTAKGEFLYVDHFNAFWWTPPVSPKNKIPLIWIQEVTDGSGHLDTGKYFFTVADLPQISELENANNLAEVLPNILQDVEYRWPPEPFKIDFKNGESWRRGHGLQFNEREMSFRNEIYPSGENVYGSFKLVENKISPAKTFGPIRVSRAYRIETDTFERVP